MKVGHRQRLRKRFLKGAEDSLSDEMLLELFLAYSIGRKDVGPLAQELIGIFGSLEQVLSASSDELMKVKGIGEATVTLLKALNFIKTGELPADTHSHGFKDANDPQLQLFEEKQDKPGPKPATLHPSVGKPEMSQEAAAIVEPSLEDGGPLDVKREGDVGTKPDKECPAPKKSPSGQKPVKRKLQVSNGYLLEFDQLARVLNFLLENKKSKRISRKDIKEDTGLADRQVESLVSIGTAMGLIKPRVQILTPAGLVIAAHDIFLERQGSLEWCHYQGAGSFRNLIWFETFNRLLKEESAVTREEWQEYFRNTLKGKYSEKTVKSHVSEEVRFIIDAYMERNFNKLEVFNQTPDSRFYIRGYTGFSPHVLAAMIYDFFHENDANLLQLDGLTETAGSPCFVFGMDSSLFREHLEGLNERGWLRYESTHNLDQIRLKPGYSAIEFLKAYFEE